MLVGTFLGLAGLFANSLTVWFTYCGAVAVALMAKLDDRWCGGRRCGWLGCNCDLDLDPDPDPDPDPDRH